MNPTMVDIPVEAQTWREARQKALARLPNYAIFAGRKVKRTHTERGSLPSSSPS